MKTMLTGSVLALTACFSMVVPTWADDKTETVRGIIAGITLEGETAIDFESHRAQTVEMTFLTIVGEPTTKAEVKNKAEGPEENKAREKGRSARRRHNVYIVWMTPRTELRDGTTSGKDENKGKDKGGASQTTLDKVEVGDLVEVSFERREFSKSGGSLRHAERMRRHGRHRTYYGNATSLTVLSMPETTDDSGPASTSPAKEKDRDDDKDKVKKES